MKKITTKLCFFLLFIQGVFFSFSLKGENAEKKFRQLDRELPTPNVYRTGSGAPGHQYWQQKTDYKISVTLSEAKNQISGTVTATFENLSPDVLSYLWVQLDQNVRANSSDTKKIVKSALSKNTISLSEKRDSQTPYDYKYKANYKNIQRLLDTFDGGFKIKKVSDENGTEYSYYIQKTMMRVDLPTPVKPNEKRTIRIEYSYNINNRLIIGGRSGYEPFEEDGNSLYAIAQFFPRLALYTDYEGWQNKQFLGRGEFTLPFGDYEVDITVPDDFIVGATGVLINPQEVLTEKQQTLLETAKTAKEPIIIVSQKEAEQKEKTKSTSLKTWKFKAENVRDFAFTGSRKYIWDAMGVTVGGKNVLAMSYYPKEANPLWEKYSTRVVAHTLKVYSKYTFDYPYPVAISVSAKKLGMEYPMICFNPGRAEEDGTYSERSRKSAISVIIHEVGHNFFPMIVNSDERQWTWMDEGLNTFLQYLTEQEWQRNYPSKRGPAYKMVSYMKGSKAGQVPIMSNSESVLQFGNNAYGKPATALNILRETVLGRELFDFSFKEYSKRWMFKHPTPADFFRTMEDASSVDLDWFWRGWFYTTDHVDVSIDGVQTFRINTKNPKIEKPFDRKNNYREEKYISNTRNKKNITQTEEEKDTKAQDFYSSYDRFKVFEQDIKDFEEETKDYGERGDGFVDVFNSKKYFHEITFSNKGGLVTPVILEFTYADDTKEVQRIPAEIWLRDAKGFKKIFVSEKKLKSVSLDPFLETADTDENNNYWPRKIDISKFSVFDEENKPENAMKKYKK